MLKVYLLADSFSVEEFFYLIGHKLGIHFWMQMPFYICDIEVQFSYMITINSCMNHAFLYLYSNILHFYYDVFCILVL